MKQVTKDLINDYKLRELKLDFMGFYFRTINQLTYHHYLISKSECKKQNLGDGYTYQNGIILEENAHIILHSIQRYDEEIFYNITSEFLDMRNIGKLDKNNLLEIHDMLDYFLKYHRHDQNSKGRYIISNHSLELKERGLERIRRM